MKRTEQKIENTWKLEDIYASREAYEKDAAALKAQIAEKTGCNGGDHEPHDRLLKPALP